MIDICSVNYAERPTIPPEDEEWNVYYRESRSFYSEDGNKYVKMSRIWGLDFDFDSITQVDILEGTKYICDNAFKECGHVSAVRIPSTVTHIGDKAFLKCYSIESIVIPETIQFVGFHAFAECSSLRRFDSALASRDGRSLIIDNTLVAIAPCELVELHIPDSVTSIAPGVFDYCPDLKSVFLPDSLVNFPQACFNNCASLQYVFSKYASEDNKCIIIDGKLLFCIEKTLDAYSIPDGVISVGVEVLGRNETIRELSLPSSVRVIESRAFAGCPSLVHITIPMGVKLIGYEAFFQCKQLKEIILPDTVLFLGASAFCGCSSLKGVVLSNSLKSIEPDTFRGCSSLLYVSIPDKVASIGESTFEECEELESVVLPKGLKVIERKLFWGCKSLNRVSFPSGLESIAECAFSYCSALKEVDISYCEKIETIENETFYQCSSIKSVALPESLVRIEYRAFSECSNLEGLYLPKSVKVISHEAFEGSGIKYVHFNSADISITRSSFSSCGHLDKVFIPNGTLDTFYSLFKSSWTINHNGHMTFFEVGDSVHDIRNESRILLSDLFINKPLYHLGKCVCDYRLIAERRYFVPINGDTKLVDSLVKSISCFASCTGCVRIGENVIYNWLGDPWPHDDTSQCIFSDKVSDVLKAASISENNDKKYVILLFALKLLSLEVYSNQIVVDDTLKQVIEYELDNNVIKNWGYIGYPKGNDSPPPAGVSIPVESIVTSIELIYALIYLLGEYQNQVR